MKEDTNMQKSIADEFKLSEIEQTQLQAFLQRYCELAKPVQEAAAVVIHRLATGEGLMQVDEGKWTPLPGIQ